MAVSRNQVTKPQTTYKENPQNNINPVPKRKRGFGKFDFPFFIVLLILVTIGIVMMFSASYAYSLKEYDDSFYLASRQIFFALIGIGGMIFVSFIDYHVLRSLKIIVPLFAASLILLVMVLFTAPVRGATRWIFGFQPSDVMKFALILLFSWYIDKYYRRMNRFTYGILPFLAILGVVAFLMMKQPHLSGTIIMVTITLSMMFVGGTKMRYIFIIGAVGVVGLVGAVMLLSEDGIGYFAERFLSFTDPFADIKDKTYQTYQSLLTIGSGGLFGVGLGNSRQKYFMSDGHNDFVFSIVTEELGFVGAVTIIILFLILIFRGFYIASRSTDKLGMMLATGIIVQIGIQAILNIAVVSNAVPNTGISLPFFSYGGTALIMQLLQMGVVLNISRQASIE